MRRRLDARAPGHPVRDVERRGDRLRFRPAADGALVERVGNRGRRTAYSRRLGSDEFVSRPRY